MRIRVSHMTRYDYERPAKSVIQLLRLTPRGHEGQQVLRWRVDIDADADVRKGEDALGNITHTAFIAGPISRLTVTVEGEVETWETHGMVRGSLERFAPEVFLGETALTAPNRALKAFASGIAERAGDDALTRLHALNVAVYEEFAFDTAPTESTTTAAEAFDLKRGVCQDLTHVFITAAREMGLPARYISGHLAPPDGAVDQEAAHAWAEAYAPDLGWIGFDPTNGISPTPAYIRVAAGRDYLGAAPVRGSRQGGGRENMDVRLNVSHAAHQTQS